MDLHQGIEGVLAAVGCTDLGWDDDAGGVVSGWVSGVHVQAWGDVSPVVGAAPGVFLRFAYTVDDGELAPVRGLRVHPAWDEAAALAELEDALRRALTRGGEAMAS
jgi:hypothetical protein